MLAGVAALASVAVLVAAGGSSSHVGAPVRPQLAAVARRLALVMNDSLPAKTARVYGPVSYERAIKAFEGGTTSQRRPGRYYLVVLRGRFVCAWCPRPEGAKSPRGSLALRVWSPSTGNNGVGLSSKLPTSMSHLGRPTRISLG